ncbi:MAG: hypothetical protein AAF533_21220 [Acidobacteriota bacterium]
MPASAKSPIASTVILIPLVSFLLASLIGPEQRAGVRDRDETSITVEVSKTAPAECAPGSELSWKPSQREVMAHDPRLDREVVRLAPAATADGAWRWRQTLVSEKPARLKLNLRTVPAGARGWTLLLDDELLACPPDPASTPDGAVPASDEWRSVLLSSELPPGEHVLTVVVAAGTRLELDSVELRPSSAEETLPPREGAPDDEVVQGDTDPCQPDPPVDPCRPAPWENVGEVVAPVSTQTRWTFDDNRFCPQGPGLDCSRIEDDGSVTNPNPGAALIDARNCSFEMYVTASCGTEMHVPLNDVESGCITVYDQNRNIVPFNVNNGDGFDEDGGEFPGDQVCWGALRCDGGGRNDPGGPGNERIMDVSFLGSPTLCGVYILEFNSWAGCIWDLFANCDGTGTEQFDIYDDECVANASVNLYPEFVITELTASDGGSCSADYCATVQNQGCLAAAGAELRVETDLSQNTHVLPSLAPGESVEFCDNLIVGDPLGDEDELVAQVVARVDPDNEIVECTEAADASSCSPATGGDVLAAVTPVNCDNSPDCDAGGPYAFNCGVNGPSFVVDGTGSSDPEGGPLTHAWSTDCFGAVIDDPTAPITTVTLDRTECDSDCSVTLLVTDEEGLVDTCSTTVSIFDNGLPTINCPEDLIAECGTDEADLDAWRNSATGSDTCDPDPLIESVIIFQDNGCGGTTNQIWRFTATDGCGNSRSCEASYTLVDTIPPEIEPPADLVIECGTFEDTEATIEAWLLTGVATDDCGGNRPVFNELLSVETGCNDTETRTYRFTASDACGNSVSATATVSRIDTRPPNLFNVPADITVNCGAIPDPPTNVQASDQCVFGLLPVTFEETEEPGDCIDERVIIRTWSAVDACDNVATEQQRITLVDADAPTLVGVPADVTLPCGDDPPVPDVTATDACDPDPTVTFSQVEIPGECPDERTLIRTWTASDRCGNDATLVQTIIFDDDEQPVMEGLPEELEITVECDAIPEPPEVTATDNCDPGPIEVVLTESIFQFPENCEGEYLIIRTWHADDRCDNKAGFGQNIHVVDTTPPVFDTTVADMTVDCQDIPPVPEVGAIDNCTSEIVVSFTETSTPGGCPDDQVITRRWEAVDDCGNLAEMTQVITVRDLTPPTLMNVPESIVAPCDAPPDPAEVTATDLCDPDPTVTFFEFSGPGTCPGESNLIRTYVATDRCGNQVAVQQIITLVDEVPPVITGVPASATVSCDDIPAPATPMITDACDAAPTLTFEEVVTPGVCPAASVIERTWTGTDGCGNVTTAVQVLTVVDLDGPEVLSIPGDVSFPCSSPLPDPVQPTVQDNCDPDPTFELTESVSVGDCADERTVTRTWLITDACGNTTIARRRFFLTDSTPPTAEPLEDLTLPCGARVPVAVPPVVTDDCDPEPTATLVTFSLNGSCSGEETIIRTWTLTDRCGNAATVQQRVFLVDEVAPELLGVPADESVSCAEVPPPAMVGVDDACDPAPSLDFVESRIDGDCPDSYQLVRTWTTVDACGNEASASQTIDVSDTVGPVLLDVPADVTVPCDAIPPMPSVTAVDDCDPSPVLVAEEVGEPGPCPGEEVIVRTWTAQDRCGNVVTASQTITIVDETAPVLVGVPADVTIGCGDPLPPIPVVTAVDDCGPAPVLTFLELLPVGSCTDDEGQVVIRTWFARDECCNTVTATQRITRRQ